MTARDVPRHLWAVIDGVNELARSWVRDIPLLAEEGEGCGINKSREATEEAADGGEARAR